MQADAEEDLMDMPDHDGRREMPRRRVVASFASHADAEEAVEYLTRRTFPVERATIVARGLQFVERVAGRITLTDAVARNTFAGALAGLLIGWLFGVFGWFHPLVAAAWLALDGLWFGALVGALFGLLQYAVVRGQRDFRTVGSMSAERYELQVDEEVADDAERLLSEWSREHRAPEPAVAGAERA